MPKEFKTLTAIVEQLEHCEYECEGGPLTMNAAFVALKDMVPIYDPPSPSNQAFIDGALKLFDEALGCTMADAVAIRDKLLDHLSRVDSAPAERTASNQVDRTTLPGLKRVLELIKVVHTPDYVNDMYSPGVAWSKDAIEAEIAAQSGDADG